MALRKINIDNSVKYIPSGNSTPNDHKPRTVSNPRKQNKKLSQNNKEFIKDIVTAEGFRIVKGIMNCYFSIKSILIRLLNRQKLKLNKRLNSK